MPSFARVLLQYAVLKAIHVRPVFASPAALASDAYHAPARRLHTDAKNILAESAVNQS